MSKSQKAVAIAKDAIWRVEHGQIKPERGYFVQVIDEPDNDQNMQVALKKGLQCEACALGGACCGLAHFENEMTVLEADFSMGVESRLSRIFGASNLKHIELAFEQGCGYFVSKSTKAESAAVEFGMRFVDSRARFLAIWRNVATHKGIFTP